MCGVGGRVGERHQRSNKPALLGQRGPDVNEQGKPNDPRKVIPSPFPFRGRGKLVLERKTNSALWTPVCGFESRVGKQHQQSPRPALLEPCEAVAKGNCLEKPSDTKHPSFPAEKHRASLREKTNKPKTGDTQPLPLKGGGVNSLWREKTRPCVALCAILGAE